MLARAWAYIRLAPFLGVIVAIQAARAAATFTLWARMGFRRW